VVEGSTLVLEAFTSGAHVVEVYADEVAAARAEVTEVTRRAADLGVRVRLLAPGVIERISDTVNPQPVVALVEGRPRSVEELLVEVRGGLVVVLAGVADPGNAGTLVRTAEATGASGVVFCGGAVDPVSPKTVRAAAGSLFRVPVATASDPIVVVGQLRELGFTVVGATLGADHPFDRFRWPEDVALVLGAEARGLPAGVIGPQDVAVSIPMAGRVESLNVAVAGSLLCFEWARHRASWGRG
jgi:TrmH family RNA methyltransferase